MFTEKEIAYLKSQRLTRFATTAPDGQPDVAPVGFEFDGEAFYIGGYNLPSTRKYKNVQAGQTQVALVVDDLQSINPWQPRGIRVYGWAEVVEHEGYVGRGDYLRITPQVSWSWNVETPRIHKTVHEGDGQAERPRRS
jgi:pyridoxamine 5'-phosphate oxidase family protein